jgi:hypothetical protein
LTVQQVTELGFPADTEIHDEDDTRGCAWTRGDSKTEASFALLAVTIHLTGDPLAAAYRENESPPQGTTFAARTVRDLPAVTLARGYSYDQCEVTVGAGNGQGIVILGHLVVGEDEPSLCDRLVTAAELVVDAVRK